MEREEEEEQMLWKSTNTMVAATIGRVMNTILSSRPKKLEEAISRLSSSPKSASLVSLEDSLWCLHDYVRNALGKNEPLDQILVPMIEHSLKYKESKHNGQAMILLNWIFQDELLFQFLAKNLSDIIVTKKDRFISLGWCILVRRIINHETTVNQSMENGKMKNYNALLKILCSRIPHVSSIICDGSTLQDGFELPTRLSVSAADCMLALTEALTKQIIINDVSSNIPKSSNRPITLIPSGGGSKNESKPSNKLPKGSYNMEMALLLWDQLDYLIVLVEKLFAWSIKSWALHAKGLDQVLKWLKNLKRRNENFQDEAGSKHIKTEVLLLCSCWKHYGMLLHLEDANSSQQLKELLDQYLSGIQFYADNQNQKHTDDKKSGIETQKFFLNCLCLLLGRANNKKFESTVSDYVMRISRVLLSQLNDADEDMIDRVVYIFKVVIFKIDGGSLSDTRQLEAVLPLLLHLLDERDGTARAAAMLIAEYCSISSNYECLHEVLKRVACGEVIQRMNALDVLSELILISSNSVNILSHSTWQEIANHLLDCIGDENIDICEKASNMLPKMDPSLVLHGLVRFVYTSDERLQISASNAIIEVVKHHNQKFDVISMLLDCVTNITQSVHLAESKGSTGAQVKLDADRVLKLVPELSKTILDWSFLIGPLIDKMFAEPSNAIIVKFLSYISDHLAEAADIVLHRVLLNMQQQKVGDENFSNGEESTYTHSLFDHLCPLLVIRLLPLRVFNDINSSIVYGQSLYPRVQSDENTNIIDNGCVAAQLLNRAFCKFEFEEVRKLAAELCGRIHPQVLCPIISSQLEHATNSEDILKIKTCLFSICTSLVVRGKDSDLHQRKYPEMLRIRKAIETVLSWPSVDLNDVSKAQHGCIDCLALMICAELQAKKSLKYSTSYKNNFGGKSTIPGDNAMNDSVLTYVIYQLTENQHNFVSSSKLDKENSSSEQSASVSFCLCMANVLISACQKIDVGKKSFARNTIPSLINSVQVTVEPEIRAACIQVLFSAVYHLKSAVLPYASDLLALSLKSLTHESNKEKMAAAKLVASLMASEEAIVQSISIQLLEARSVLSRLSSTDPSPEVRQICEKLLICLTSS